MTGKSLTTILLSIALAAGAICTGNTETPTIVVATDPTYPPMEFLNDSGEMVGFDIELMEAVAGAGKFNVQFKSVPWDAIFGGLLDGSCDAIISSVTITEERRKDFDFSSPYIKADQVLVAERTSESVSSIADLGGKRIGVLVGSAASAALDGIKDNHNIRIVDFRDHAEAVTDLLNGDVDAVAVDLIYARILTHEREYGSRLRIVDQPIATEEFGIVVKKGNRALLRRIDRGLKKVVESGQLEQIEEKWFDWRQIILLATREGRVPSRFLLRECGQSNHRLDPTATDRLCSQLQCSPSHLSRSSPAFRLAQAGARHIIVGDAPTTLDSRPLCSPVRSRCLGAGRLRRISAAAPADGPYPDRRPRHRGSSSARGHEERSPASLRT
jgi:polar amino acid transport system substrate-binding protein